MKLEIGTWQFVRIMVELEDRQKGQKRTRASVYDDWQEPWEELDNRLTELGESDQAAYSDLMMNQNVVLDCRGPAQLRELGDVLVRIIETMRAKIDRGGPNDRLKDLGFEARELGTLRQELAVRARAENRRKPRPSRGATGKTSGKKRA